jgi:addiction module RelE/StbE family toxin
MRHEIRFAPEALEDLKRLSARNRRTIRDAIEHHLRDEPQKVSQSRIKRLRELRHPQYHLRVNEWRIFYDVTDQTVEIIAVVPKSQASDWLEQFGEQA